MPAARRCILLLVDGLRPDLAEGMLADGRLPHLAAMVAGGGGTSRAVTAFPSTTSVAYLPFLTGATPGRCNVPSIRWLDRAAYRGRWWADREAVRSYCGYQAGRLDGDIAPDVATIFELVPDSVGIFTPVARGLAPGRDPARGERKFWGALAHYAQWHQPSDESAGRHLLRAIEGPARFIFAQFPAVDGYTHQSTPDGQNVRRALARFDALVGRLRARLRARGELDETLILVVSDHGATVVHTHLDLADWFRGRGVPTLSHPRLWERAPRAAVMVAGNGSAMVYAQPGRCRAERFTLEELRRPGAFGSADDLIGRLVREEAVGLIAAEAAGGGITVASAAGEATLRRVGTDIDYRPHTADPLDVGGGACRSPRAWLAGTMDGPWPDAPYQLLDQFRASRTGDLVVMAREGYDFRRRFEVPEHRAGHGSLFGAHMRVPVWSSHGMAEAPLRTVDLFPAMLHWLGVPAPGNLDGELVWAPEARKARPGPAAVALQEA